MYDYIQISKIRAFLFCPHSIYFQSVYEDFDNLSYEQSPQIAGHIAHKTVDEKKAGNASILKSTEIFSERHGIVGKIDLFDTTTGELIERKRTIIKVRDGYRFQLWAQKCCLEEMGYTVSTMTLHSLTDNKKYNVHMNDEDISRFNSTLVQMRNFHPLQIKKTARTAQCAQCIYRELCKKTV